MASNAQGTLGLPRRAPDAAAVPRRPSLRLAAAVLVAVLALALAALRVDALPRSLLTGGLPLGSRWPPTAWVPASLLSPPDPLSTGAAASLGRGAAAAAVGRLVAAPAGQNPLLAVPAGFPAVMHYTPVATRMADGVVRLAKPDGACSAPGGGRPFGFERACKVHDYGYDLLRYANASGQVLTGEARRQLDGMFDHDLHAQCRATSHGLARLGCGAVAEAFGAAVAFNSWRQHYGNPGKEPLPRLALGLAVLLALAAALLWR
jgi:hypothetical protein